MLAPLAAEQSGSGTEHAQAAPPCGVGRSHTGAGLREGLPRMSVPRNLVGSCRTSYDQAWKFQELLSVGFCGRASPASRGGELQYGSCCTELHCHRQGCCWGQQPLETVCPLAPQLTLPRPKRALRFLPGSPQPFLPAASSSRPLPCGLSWVYLE